MGGSSNGDTQKNRWMVYVMENPIYRPIYKWMMNGGSPITGNLQIASLRYGSQNGRFMTVEKL